MDTRQEFELRVARVFRAHWIADGWDMVDAHELLALADEVQIPQRLAERILDDMDSRGLVQADGRHFRGGIQLVLDLEQNVDRALFYESNGPRRELLAAAADALDAGDEVEYHDHGDGPSYTSRPWTEARMAAKFLDAIGWGELREAFGHNFWFEITADGYALARDAERLIATLPLSADEDRAFAESETDGPHEAPEQRRADEPGVFISYSHHDSEFVLALVDALSKTSLRIWIDRVELAVGDSLATRIAEAIVNQDFVVAVVSEHSVASSWCQKELSLAITLGINNKRVVVLPVRLGEVEMPATLKDVFFVSARSADEVGVVAAALTKAVAAHSTR